MAEYTLSGIWRSHYGYHSHSRNADFEDEHLVRLHHRGHQLVIESLPEVNTSYVIIRLSLADNVATGSWEEHTDPSGYYKGAVYHGAVQLVLAANKRRLSGKWVGFGKDMKVNVGSWEFVYLGKTLPANAPSPRTGVEGKHFTI
jgi:hypothetical protein